jgi:F-type H+-transporting ATPase subunit delta
MLSALAIRYAKALADVVADSKLDAARVTNELRSVDSIIEGSAPLKVALASPAVSPARKRAVLSRLIEPMGVTDKVRNFLFVISDHRRMTELKSITEAFEKLIDERLGFARAEISSAHELSEAQRAALAAELTRLTGKEARLHFSTDPSLIGGVVARVGSTVYDGSIRGQLDRLRIKLAAN